MAEKKAWAGSWVAVVTPFRQGSVDEEALRQLLDWHRKAGTDGIVACGTTGEAATLSADEWDAVVRIAVEEAGGEMPVMAGTGSNNTAATVERTKRARELGADAALVVTPYYNKPTAEGQYRHYIEVVEKSSLPIVLYNVPGRTGTNMTPDTIARLAEHDGIVALKDASGNVVQAAQVLEKCGDALTLLSGEDSLNFPLMAQGASGVVSVTANVEPAKVADMVNACLSGEWERARQLHFELLPLSRALFVESNPIPVKAALAMCGRIKEEYRLPLCALAPENKEQLRSVVFSD